MSENTLKQNNFVEIITNASYWQLFENTDSLRKDQYLVPNFDSLESLDHRLLTRTLCILFQKNDVKKDVIYGIEIKSNGSERSSRIPLVRVLDGDASIWKIALGITSLEKSVIILNELVYFLEQHSNGKYPIPKKIIVLKDKEDLFVKKGSEYYVFVKNIFEKNNISIISMEFFKNILNSKKPVDLDSLLNKEKQIITIQSYI